MLFNSYSFILVFLPFVLCGYYALGRWQNTKVSIAFLIAASLVFYAGWNVSYVPLLIVSILFNYKVGFTLAKHRRKRLLMFGVAVNLALLAYFKYARFFAETWNLCVPSSLPVPDIVLPLGISFFTFTQTAYLVDAYRGETKGHSFLTFCLFVTIFPHLIAGPILYHKKIIPQFLERNNFQFYSENFTVGLMWFAIGLFKKVAIADTLAPWVNLAFANAAGLTFFEAWAGAIGYTMQLYFDFSGYSEMAVGLGYMLNLRLPINFNAPYQATSVIDFWHRWHMTLSEFLKNYLYIPLGGNRNGHWAKMRNLMITMLLGGLWHGAGWTFVAWGGLHGLFLVINHTWRKYGVCLPRVVNWSLTFLCIVVAWVFFRAESLGDALKILSAMTDLRGVTLPSGGFYESHFSFLQQFGVAFAKLQYWGGTQELIWITGCMAAVLWLRNTQERLIAFRPQRKWAAALAGILFYTLLAMHTSTSEFLYFQF